MALISDELLAELQKLRQQLGPSEDDQRQARGMGLLAAGLGTLGTRAANPLVALGQGGLLGMAAQQQMLRDAAASRGEGFQNLGNVLQLSQQMQAMSDEQKAREIAMGQFGAPKATAAPVAFGGQPPAPSFSAPPAAAPSAIPAPDQGPPSMASRSQMADAYEALAQRFYNAGLLKQATAALEQARTMRPKMKEQKNLTTASGSRVVVTYFEDGTSRVEPFGPDQEKAVFSNEGGVITPRDPFTAKPVGAAIPVSVSPDTQYRGAVDIRGQNLTDARAREQLAQGKWTNDLERGVQINLNTGETRPITASGIPVGPANAQQKAEEWAQLRDDAARAKAMLPEIKGAVGYTTAGLGSNAAYIRGTGARDLEERVKTLQSILGLGKLQQLKNASKNGASGFGQLTEKEMELLTSNIANLSTSQSPQQLIQNLDAVDKYLGRILGGGKNATPLPSEPPPPPGEGWKIKRVGG